MNEWRDSVPVIGRSDVPPHPLHQGPRLGVTGGGRHFTFGHQPLHTPILERDVSCLSGQRYKLLLFFTERRADASCLSMRADPRRWCQSSARLWEWGDFDQVFFMSFFFTGGRLIEISPRGECHRSYPLSPRRTSIRRSLSLFSRWAFNECAFEVSQFSQKRRVQIASEAANITEFNC